MRMRKLLSEIKHASKLTKASMVLISLTCLSFPMSNIRKANISTLTDLINNTIPEKRVHAHLKRRNWQRTEKIEIARRHNGKKYLPAADVIYRNQTEAIHREIQSKERLNNKQTEPSKKKKEMDDKVIEDRFFHRKQLIKSVCGKIPPRKTPKVKRMYRLPFHWCRIHKVASSFLTDLGRLLSKTRMFKGKPFPIQRKVLMVRDPYWRMVSGYLDRIVTLPAWWPSYGRLIVSKFRSKASFKERFCGSDVTFPEFIKYFIYSQEQKWFKNDHFVPMSEQCNPCKTPFDFVAHVETSKEDLRYILKIYNMSINTTLEDQQGRIKGKAKLMIQQKEKIKRCEPMCKILEIVWWSFQARGLVHQNLNFPIRGDECDVISADKFADLCWDAHLQSIGRIDKWKQKRQAMSKLFLQVPLADRIKVRDILAMDFRVFGYNAQPDDLFPELSGVDNL